MKNQHLEGIDYLRAFMSVFVVIWHMNGAGKSLIFSPEHYPEHVFTFSDLINFHLLMLAVPVFILVSSYLYAAQPHVLRNLAKRVSRLFILLSFWPVALLVWQSGNQGLEVFSSHSASDLIISILRAGNTIYYFFASLIICLVITHVAATCKLGWQMAGLGASCLLVLLAPIVAKSLNFYSITAYWSPINFVPYCFAALLLYHYRHLIQARQGYAVVMCWVLAIICAFYEWHYAVGGGFIAGQGYAIPAYTRLSLFFCAVGLIIVAINPKIKAPGLIRFMAGYSLALYCIHPFFIAPVSKKLIEWGGISNALIAVAVVVVCSYAAAWVLKNYLNKSLLE